MPSNLDLYLAQTSSRIRLFRLYHVKSTIFSRYVCQVVTCYCIIIVICKAGFIFTLFCIMKLVVNLRAEEENELSILRQLIKVKAKIFLNYLCIFVCWLWIVYSFWKIETTVKTLSATIEEWTIFFPQVLCKMTTPLE